MHDLVAAGLAVRALVRNPSRAVGLEGAQVVQGGFEDDASLARASDGVDAMLLAGRDSPDAVSQHQRVLAHARGANLQHIVKLSAISASWAAEGPLSSTAPGGHGSTAHPSSASSRIEEEVTA